MENFIQVMRRRREMSQAELAEKVGVSIPQVSKWEKGVVDIPMSRLRSIAEALECNIMELIALHDFEDIKADMLMEDIARRGNAQPVRMEGASEERMREDLPIFGTVLGAPKVVEGESIEQTMLNTGEIIQYVKRPVILNGRADAYGLYIQGNSMAPVYLEGEMALAETKRPARIGDDVAVYLRSREEDDGERARSVLLKRLVRRTASYIELEQFNPAITFRIPAEDVLRIDRILRLPDLLL